MKKLAITLIALMFCGCVQSIRDIEKDENGFIYGYIDMSDAPGKLYDVHFLQTPAKQAAYFGVANDIQTKAYDSGLFFGMNVEPANYWFYDFFTDDKVTCQVAPLPTKENTFRIRKKEMKYMGSYKFVMIKDSGMFSRGSYTLKPVSSPTEKEVLLMVLEKVKGTGWEKRVKQRLGSIR